MKGFKRKLALVLSFLIIFGVIPNSSTVMGIPATTATIGYHGNNENAGDIDYQTSEDETWQTVEGLYDDIQLTSASSITVEVSPADGYEVRGVHYDDSIIDVDINSTTYVITPGGETTYFDNNFDFKVEFGEQAGISRVITTAGDLVSGAAINYYRIDGDNLSPDSSYTDTTDINGIFSKYSIEDGSIYVIVAEKDTMKGYDIVDRNNSSVELRIPEGISEISDSTVIMDMNGVKVTLAPGSEAQATHFYVVPLLKWADGIDDYGFPSIGYRNEELVEFGNYYNESSLDSLEDDQRFVIYYLNDNGDSNYSVTGYQVGVYDRPIVNRLIDVNGQLINAESEVEFYNISSPQTSVATVSSTDGLFTEPDGLDSSLDYIVTGSTEGKLGYNEYDSSGTDIMLYDIDSTSGDGSSEIRMAIFNDEIDGPIGEVGIESRSSEFIDATKFDAHILFDGWNIDTFGLPTANNIGSIGSPDSISIVPEDGESYDVMILYFSGDNDNLTFLGYDIVQHTYEAEGNNETPQENTITFKINEEEQSLEVQRDLIYYVPVPSGPIDIEFLDDIEELFIEPILPVRVAEMEGDEDAVADWLDEIGAVVEGKTISFGDVDPLKRITVVVRLGGDEYRIVFMQPGYDDPKINLDFNEEELDDIEIEVSKTDPENRWRTYRFNLPSLDTFQAEYTVTMTNPPEMKFTGVLEYNADRSDFVSVVFGEQADDYDLITANRGYGSVELHCQYHLGNSWEDSFVILREDDFFTVDIEPDFRIADWESGVTNLSESWDLTEPVSYVYFLNENVKIMIPDYLSKNYNLNSVSVAGESVDETDGYWLVPLTSQYNEDTIVDLEIQKGVETPYTKQLIIRKTALSTQSEYWGDDIDNPEDVTLMTYINAYGSDEQPEDMIHEDDILYPEFDIRGKVIVVNYYDDDRIIGTREYPIPNDLDDYEDMGFDRKIFRVKVYDEFDAEFAGIRSANRISAFLLNNSLKDNFFGGTRFGFGAGWGHLLPTHPDFGSGKDGMESERGGNR